MKVMSMTAQLARLHFIPFVTLAVKKGYIAHSQHYTTQLNNRTCKNSQPQSDSESALIKN